MKKVFLSVASLLMVSSLVACNDFSSVTEFMATTSGHYSDIQLVYLQSENYADTTPYNGNMSKSDPNPVRLTWKSGKGQYLLRFTNDYNPEDETEYYTKDNPFDFYNPILGATYTVTIKYRGYHLVETTFKENVTVPGPRNIRVEGVENFRDIGGWGRFVDGEYKTYMKQGMIYRSGRFNEDKAESITLNITNSGMKEVNNHLKIKTEIDLRRTSTNEVGSLTNKSVLGDGVKYVQLPMVYGGENILTFKGKVSKDDYEYNNPAMIKQFFELLADSKNYPINYHCSIGKDRTGCLSYLLEGLMGFDQETMYRDYMFTNFANAGMCKLTDITDRYGKTIADYANGESLQEKVYNYLNEVVGVSTTDLNNVINILKA